MLSLTADALGLAPGSLEFEICDRRDETVVAACGEIDLASAPALDAILHRVARLDAPVRLDLTRVGFIDSAGLHAIEIGLRRARRSRRSLAVGPVSDVVAQVIELTGAPIATAA